MTNLVTDFTPETSRKVSVIHVNIKAMQNATINTSYYCECPKGDGPVLVFTTGAYRVAEFNQSSGKFNWHRVVPAPQKAIIEKWFDLRFPQAALEVAAVPEPTTPTKPLTRHARA